MLVLGLTGNIGCGKSSLSNILIQNNIEVIDADIISRNIFEDKELLNLVFENFGENIKNLDGSLNRKALGNIVFNDDQKLVLLNGLTHPKIKEKILNKINEIRNIGKSLVVIDAALLIEGGYLDILDKLIVITCKESIQISRVQLRDNLTKEQAISRMNSQMSQDEKIKYADYIIDNSGDTNNLKHKAEELIRYMKENWCG